MTFHSNVTGIEWKLVSRSENALLTSRDSIRIQFCEESEPEKNNYPERHPVEIKHFFEQSLKRLKNVPERF